MANLLDLEKVRNGEKNLSHASLSYADLSYENLSGANLSYANLFGANLSDANLSRANLSRANLFGANLSYASLSGAYLSRANLSGANLSGADLSGANLIGADLFGAKNLDEHTAAKLSVPPEEGSFIAFKKCRYDTIVKLYVPSDAKRSSATTRKCRVSRAKVVEITPKSDVAYSLHDANFEYPLNEFVECPDFDEDRWNECSEGIHCFLTRIEAKRWF